MVQSQLLHKSQKCIDLAWSEMNDDDGDVGQCVLVRFGTESSSAKSAMRRQLKMLRMMRRTSVGIMCRSVTA